MNDSYTKASDLINSFFDSNSQSQVSVLTVWSKVVSTVKNNGLQLADHSRVLDYKNGTLLVEADHSAWIQILQINRKYIINGLQRNLPNLEIRNLMFKLSGQVFRKEEKKVSKAELLDELNRKYAPLEEEIEKTYKNNSENSLKIDDRLKELFDKLKNDIQSC